MRCKFRSRMYPDTCLRNPPPYTPCGAKDPTECPFVVLLKEDEKP